MAITKVETLNDNQIAQLSVYREKWIGHGLSTEPADRLAAQEAVAKAYRAAGIEPPKIFIWLRSPFEGCLGSAFLLHLQKHLSQVRDQVGDQVLTQVRAQVLTQVVDQVGDHTYYCGYGHHDAEWLSFYDYMGGVVGIAAAERLAGLIALTKSCGWWWPFQGACILTERPCHLARDQRNRLHCETRAAIEYPDGWGVYSWHGTRVPADVILNPESITVERIDYEQNAEIRRVMLERYGWGRYLENNGATVVHSDARGILYRKEIPGDEPLVMVKVKNSTPEPDGSSKDYLLRVPPDMTSASQAVAWTFGISTEQYSPIVET